jgi:hypothetical protein
MATELGNFPIKILAQVADNQPIELGVYELPLYAGKLKPVDEGNYQVEITCGAVNAEELAKILDRSVRHLALNPNF